MFTQQGSIIPGTNGITHAEVECYRCHQLGHYASNCPSPEEESGMSLVQWTLAQTERYEGIPEMWILLDTQLTVSVFNNPKFIMDIRHSGHTL